MITEEKCECNIEEKEQKYAWTRLIAKVSGVDPLTCPRCGSPMKIIAIIMNSEEIRKILKHLVKIGRALQILILFQRNFI